jgi:hypothetical protein
MIAPKTANKDHVFYNTTSFGDSENIVWNNSVYAVLTHTNNNGKFYIDASRSNEVSAWRNSNISYHNIVIGNSKISFGKNPRDFATYYNANFSIVNVILEFTSNQNRRIISHIDSNRPLTRYDGFERSDLDQSLRGKYSNYSYVDNQLRFSTTQLSDFEATAVSTINFSSTVKRGIVNQIIDLQVLVKDSNGFGVESAPVYLFVESGQQQRIIHSHGLYSLTDVNGIATTSVMLKTEGICKIKAYVNSPNELITTSSFEITCGIDETEIYLRNVTYETRKYTNDYKATYDHLTSLFYDIVNFTWSEVGFSQADILNASDTVNNEMVIFVKGATFNSKVCLTLQEASDLRMAIYNALMLDGSFTVQDIEIRSYRRFVNL